MIDIITSKWEDIISFLRDEYDLSDVSYKTWILPIKPHHIETNSEGENILHIIVPEQQFVNYVNRKYSFLLNVAIQEKTGCRCEIVFETEEDAQKSNSSTPTKKLKSTVDAQILNSANLNPKYTFNTFVVGKSNNIAHAASLAVAESPGEIYNPLFLYGGVGLGKTHLMHSIANFILENNPKAKILYVTSETFTNELIESIRNRNDYSSTEFRNKYRNNDVLLIDDIQFIIGKESTQEEFFHTFNALHEAKKQIIISSDKPPKDFETLEERLRSRFEWGLSVDIQPPDYETRMAILRKKEELEGMNIDNEVIKYIATHINSNIRELEGALTKIVAMGRLDNREINLQLAQDVLHDLISPAAPSQITPELILQVVAEHYGLSSDDLIGQKRTKEITYPRQIAMYLCSILTDSPLIQIGKSFGGRDHATIVHGSKKISMDIKSNSELSNTIDIIKKKIYPQ